MFKLMDKKIFIILRSHSIILTFVLSRYLWNGPFREKTCLWGFCQSEIQTGLLSYRDLLENWSFTCSKVRYGTFQKANNKGADQTAP